MGGFPDGKGHFLMSVREKEWFPGRSIFFGEERSGKWVVFRTEYLFWGSTFGKMGDFPDGVAGTALQQPGGLKYLAD